MVDGLITLSDRIYGWRAESDLQVTKFRGSGFLRGRHAYKIADDGYRGLSAYRGAFCLSEPRGGGLWRTRRRPASSGSIPCWAAAFRAVPRRWSWVPPASARRLSGFTSCRERQPDEPGLMFGFYETPASLRAKADRIVPSLGPLFDSGAVEMLWQTPTSDLLDAYGQHLHRGGPAAQGKTAVHRRPDGFPQRRHRSVAHWQFLLRAVQRASGARRHHPLFARGAQYLGPAVNVPLDDASSLAENMILLRFVERGSRLHRVISVLKARDSDFDPSLYEYDLTDKGMVDPRHAGQRRADPGHCREPGQTPKRGG